ncbi:MAG: AAA family ATPase [Paludibacteraceae bacterium]|nr:AAA family ATPase [Paludibacteraceae bacterium]
MANIILNTSDLFALLNVMDDVPEQNILLVGKHGIGKSEILTKYFTDKGMKVVPFFLGQMSDPGDLIGLPRVTEDGRTEFMPPFWFPTDNKPIVLFLDELNRARPEILQVIMDLCLNKKLAGRSLPAGSRIIAAVNGGQEYNVTELDPALVSRFNIVDFVPSCEEWISWACKNNLDQRVIDFISNNYAMLDGQDLASAGLTKTPDRRGWKKVSDVLLKHTEINDTLTHVIAAIIGVSASAAFVSWMKENHLPSGEDILLRFTKTKKSLQKLQIHELASVTTSVLQTIDQNFENVKYAKGFIAYANFLFELPEKGQAGINNSLEAFHDFHTQMMGKQYSHVISFASKNAMDVLNLLTKALSV